MARIITDFRISYVDSTGTPRSESFDMEDFNEYEGSIDSTVNELVAAGANNIRVEITTDDYEKGKPNEV